MGLFDERVAYKPFEYPEYYTEGWLKQAQAFWLHTEMCSVRLLDSKRSRLVS